MTPSPARPTDLADAALLRQCADGNGEAFGHLLRRHQRPMLALARSLLGRPEDAEEVMQEVALKVWRAAADWQPDGEASFATWLHRVVLNACLDRRRQARHAPLEEADELADGAPPAWETVLADQRRRALRTALALLPERQRSALMLYYFGQMSAPEVAGRLGLSLSACQALLARGKTGLRRALRQAGLGRAGELL